ncbi:MAG: hypothetical protein ACLFNU_06650 [Bacteroidales bacterium]
MKKLSLFFIFVIFGAYTFSQEITEDGKIPEKYDRSSLTVMFVDLPSVKYWNQVKSKIDSIYFSDKYDNNNLESALIKPSSGFSSNDLQEAIKKDLLELEVGKKIISKWYNRQPDGTMNMEVVHKRGRFSASDADFLKADATKRGESALRDYGSRLIGLSHILVIGITDVKTASDANIKNMKGWQANVSGMLFRVDFNDEMRNALYETWIYEDDSDEVKEQKKKAFEALEVPINHVTTKSMRVTAMQPDGDSGLSLFFKPKTKDELLQELVQKSYDEVVYRIEMDVKEFQVLTSLYDKRPLNAKIGLKEGLKTDNRFFVYEHIYNPKTNETVPKRRGVIRAKSKSKIVDNRYDAMGDMEASEFYQVHGRRLEPGFTMQQQNDYGIEVSLGAELGEIGGFYGRADYRLGRFVGIRALFAYGEFGIDAENYPNFPYYGDTFFNFLRYGVGLAKGLQLTRNVELRIYLGAGGEQASNSDFSEDDAFTAVYVKPGANMALNLSHNFQITGGIGAYAFISDGESESGMNIGQWDQAFSGRSGSSTFIGLKLGF